MAITIDILVERVLYALGLDERSAGVTVYQIESRIADACDILSTQVMMDRDPHRRALLAKTFEIALTDGEGTMPDDLRVQSIPRARATFTTSDESVSPRLFARQLIHLPTSSDLELPLPIEWIYYAVEGTKVLTRDTDGALDGLNGTLTIRDGIFQPVVAVSSGSTTLPVELETDLVVILASLTAPARAGAVPVPPPA